MDWGKKLRKQANDAKQAQEDARQREPEELLKYAKDELTEHMNYDLGEVLEIASNNGLTHFSWNDVDNNPPVCSDICHMVINYKAESVISAFKTMGLKFRVNTISYDINSYVISWE